MSAAVSQENCPLCEKDLKLKDTVKIREIGAKGINEASTKRGLDIFVSAGTEIHKECREKHVNKKDIELSLKRKHGEQIECVLVEGYQELQLDPLIANLTVCIVAVRFLLMKGTVSAM